MTHEQDEYIRKQLGLEAVQTPAQGSMGIPAAEFEIERLQGCCASYRAEIEHLKRKMTEPDWLDYRAISVFLWSLLDNIDTTSGIADEVAYRIHVERIQKRRFEVSTSEGFDITFKCNPK